MSTDARRIDLVTAVAAAALTLGIGAILVAVAGASPMVVLARLVSETLLSPYGLGQSLFNATPLIFTGLAVALPFRAGLFNIGAEGQLYVGAFAAAALALALPGVPGPMLCAGVMIAAALGGALWGGIAGALKSRFGAHEVISTIMLNFVAIALTGYVVTYHMAVPETIHTEHVPSSIWLPRLSTIIPAFRGASVSVALAVALVVAALVHVFLWRTPLGFELRAVGLNPRAAGAAGIAVGARQRTAFVLGGAMAGLVGVHEVLGYRHYFGANFSDGVGFMGIAVAMLGQSRPIGVVLAALLFGAMQHGGLTVSDLVPKEIVSILQGVVILMILVSRSVAERLRVERAKAALAGRS